MGNLGVGLVWHQLSWGCFQEPRSSSTGASGAYSDPETSDIKMLIPSLVSVRAITSTGASGLSSFQQWRETCRTGVEKRKMKTSYP